MTPTADVIRSGKTPGEYHLGGNVKDWGSAACEECWTLLLHSRAAGWRKRRALRIKQRVFNDTERPILFVGPWYGEFGWELARWQGAIRKIAEDDKGLHQIIVMGDHGHDCLYEYADEYWEVPVFFREAEFTRLSVSVHGHVARIYLKALAYDLSIALEGRHVDRVVYPKRFKPQEQKHIRLGGDIDTSEPTFCYSPRERNVHPERNWPMSKWKNLIRRIERKTGLKPIPLTERTNLSTSIGHLRASKFALCPESGSIFLALLCGTPTVAFGHEKWRERVTTTENFLGTPVTYVGQPHHEHTVKEVFDAAQIFCL